MFQSTKSALGLVCNIDDNITHKEASDILAQLYAIDPKIFEKSVKDSENISKNLSDIGANTDTKFETNLRQEKLTTMISIIADMKKNKKIIDAEILADKLKITHNDRKNFILAVHSVTKKTKNPDTISGWLIRVLFNYFQQEWFNIFILVCIMYILNSFYNLIIWLRIQIATFIMPKNARKQNLAHKIIEKLSSFFGPDLF